MAIFQKSKLLSAIQMKPLRTLIKLHKQQLDDLLVEITALEKRKENLTRTLEELEARAKAEMQKYAGSEYAFMLDSYLRQVDINKKHFTAQIEGLDKQILALREALADQFAELKKFEIALQNRIVKEQEQQKRTEAKLLDEFNSGKFARSTKNKDN